MEISASISENDSCCYRCQKLCFVYFSFSRAEEEILQDEGKRNSVECNITVVGVTSKSLVGRETRVTRPKPLLLPSIVRIDEAP